MIKETSVFMEKMNITNQEHDAFVKAHPQGDLLQLTKWAETKTNGLVFKTSRSWGSWRNRWSCSTII